ncbi:MAG TPA: HEAT repeat domain-containing protein [Candidatus Bathyarchaeia archaeon]|nr:HEAT repeat domain-containing protein [Candidatus Bathyarchaeia archaeon]
MSDFEYTKMIEQILNRKDQKEREELFNFIGEKGDDRFVEPLTELIKLDDSPKMRQSLYSALTKIGTNLADDVIKTQIKLKLPKDDGKKITKKSWDEAVFFLASNLEPVFIKKVKQIIQTEGSLWGHENKGGIGVYVRNLLRNNGFNWGETALEAYWPWVVEEVLKKTE